MHVMQLINELILSSTFQLLSHLMTMGHMNFLKDQLYVEDFLKLHYCTSSPLSSLAAMCSDVSPLLFIWFLLKGSSGGSDDCQSI